jgi:hypothetical protein
MRASLLLLSLLLAAEQGCDGHLVGGAGVTTPNTDGGPSFVVPSSPRPDATQRGAAQPDMQPVPPASPDGGMSPKSYPQPPAGERPAKPGGMCARCVDSADCLSPGACIELPRSKERICSAACSADSQCPAGYRCGSCYTPKKELEFLQTQVCGTGKLAGVCVPETNTCATGGGHLYGGYVRQVYVQLADGTSSVSCVKGAPKPYTCKFGSSVEDCKNKIKAELYKRWAPYNLEVTFEKPALHPYYHIMIMGDMAGVGYSSAACFDAFSSADRQACFWGCGYDLEACVRGIVHEVGHLMSLGHVGTKDNIPLDVMYSSLGTLSNGKWIFNGNGYYEDNTYPVPDPCPGRNQNSHQQVLFVVGKRQKLAP